jgi:hypothetical protein
MDPCRIDEACQLGICIAALPDCLVAEIAVAIHEGAILGGPDAERIGLVGEFGGQDSEGHDGSWCSVQFEIRG